MNEQGSRQGTPQVTASPSPIGKATEDLCNAVGTLDDSVNALARRLGDVLSPELSVDTSTAGSKPIPPPGNSAMNERITMAVGRIDAVTEHLQRLLQRLEV